MTDSRPSVRVCLMHVPGCPLTDRVRVALREAMHATGVRAVVEDREGAYPSPTLLINGRDVLTGAPGVRAACCRLEIPTADDITAALRREVRPPRHQKEPA